MADRFDILGLGCVSIDDLLFVAEYPPADSKTQVRRHERHCGGLTATALVAAARLGSHCALATTLGDDELSRFVLGRLSQEGVDTSQVRRQAAARPIHAVIVVDETTKTRTIFFDLAGTTCDPIDWPEDEVIRSARVLFVDHLGVERMIRAGRVARAAGVPVVADLESDEHPRFLELLALVEHLILSRDFAAKLTGQSEPGAAVEQLWSPERQAVVVTGGSQGCWYRGEGSPWVRHQPAFRVEVVDTTGCGDVFHGAYASALAEGLDLPARVRLAAATAALKATQPGGQAGIPTRETVAAFLGEYA